MPRFHYQALNAQQQIVTGELSADSVAQAVTQLEADGLTVQSISLATEVVQPAPAGSSPFAIGDSEAPLARHLREVLERGHELAPALKAYAEEIKSTRRRRELQTVVNALELGPSPEAITALEKLPGYWIPLLTVAGSSRDPARALQEFLRESQRADDLYRQWLLTLAYPMFVAGLAILILFALGVFVVPIFRAIFEGFQIELPRLTKFVLAITRSLTSGEGFVGAAIVAAIVATIIWLLRFLPKRLRSWFGDRFGTPFGRLTTLARFAAYTADLLEAGLAIPQSLRLAGMVTASQRIRRAAWQLANDLETGSQTLQPIQRRILTETVIHALRDDMPAGARIRLLREVGSSYAFRASTRMSWTRGIVEPIAICVVGLMVGAVVLSLFLPLITLVIGLS